ncbi:response regulator transcription factor [Streptomyces sp. NPDC094143]|uniref:response regulator transcription factor n=1 Tax=Streptomyces sp. NPDC094143 TaxID=3155310 RepID=UPI00331BB2A6
MCAHALIAEDDPKQAEVVRRYLTLEGHRATVVHDGGTALASARALRPDVLILDVMMPGADGHHVCRMLRAEREDLAILMLTARSTEEDLLTGLESGADDYLTKPYSPRELTARVRTLLRRVRRPETGGEADLPLRVGAVTVHRAQHTVTVHGSLVECTPGEFQLLAALAARPDQVFTRRQLLAHTQGFDRYITERSIDMHVMNLRRKIEADPRRPTRLVTVYGVGYKLTDPDPDPDTGTGAHTVSGPVEKTPTRPARRTVDGHGDNEGHTEERP